MLRLPGIFLFGQVAADDKRIKVTVNGKRIDVNPGNLTNEIYSQEIKHEDSCHRDSHTRGHFGC